MRSDDPSSDPNPLDSRPTAPSAGVAMWLGQVALPTAELLRKSAADQDEAYEDPAIDMSENELHAGTGQVCPVCHRAIAREQAVRLRIDGTYQHDACP